MAWFHELLKKALKRRNIRGYQLAKLTGCAQSAVSEANTGKDAPRHEMAVKWAEALGITGKEREEWLDAAAAQRAQRSDINGRKGEGRLARRIEHLEQVDRNLTAALKFFVNGLDVSEATRGRLLDLFEHEAQRFDAPSQLVKQIESILTEGASPRSSR